MKTAYVCVCVSGVYVDVACISWYDCMSGGPQEEKLMQMLMLKVDPNKNEDHRGICCSYRGMRCASEPELCVSDTPVNLTQSMKAPEPSLNSLKFFRYFVGTL